MSPVSRCVKAFLFYDLPGNASRLRMLDTGVGNMKSGVERKRRSTGEARQGARSGNLEKSSAIDSVGIKQNRIGAFGCAASNQELSAEQALENDDAVCRKTLPEAE